MRKINQLLRKNKRELDRSMNQLVPLRKKTESLIKNQLRIKITSQQNCTPES